MLQFVIVYSGPFSIHMLLHAGVVAVEVKPIYHLVSGISNVSLGLIYGRRRVIKFAQPFTLSHTLTACSYLFLQIGLLRQQMLFEPTSIACRLITVCLVQTIKLDCYS